jgi:hypothetical protein
VENFRKTYPDRQPELFEFAVKYIHKGMDQSGFRFDPLAKRWDFRLGFYRDCRLGLHKNAFLDEPVRIESSTNYDIFSNSVGY